MQTSLFDRVFSARRPAWVVLFVCLLSMLLPVGIAALDGAFPQVFTQGHWRVLYLPLAIILYIWLISPLLARRGAEVIRAMQSITNLDEENFTALVKKATTILPWQEVLVFGIGFMLGFWAAQASGFEQSMPALRIYWFIASSLMDGVVLWAIFVSVSSTRLNAALHRQPLQIDLFEQAPFEAIGRQSLLLALVFTGGITISVVFSIQVGSLLTLGAWLVYLGLILATVLIFFFSMLPTHQVLSKARQAELVPLRRLILRTSRELVRRLGASEPPGDLPAQIQALTLYEGRLLAVRTWPYNTAMLRTLFFSVFIPLLTVLVRRAAEVLFLSNP